MHNHKAAVRAVGGRSGRTAPIASAAVLVLGLLTGCSAEYDAGDIAYAGDYGSHPPLAVVGFPSTGTLGITQQVVWRIADGKPGELAALGDDTQDEDAVRKTAGNWIAAFGKGARGKVTAEFYDEGSYRQTVVLYLHGTGQIKEIYVLPQSVDRKGVYRVSMNEPDPADATAVGPWVPTTPGALGSTMIR